jgi:hypothetical protein
VLTIAVGAALGTVAGSSVVVLFGWMQFAHILRIFD